MIDQKKISARFGLIMKSTSKVQGDLAKIMDSSTSN